MSAQNGRPRTGALMALVGIVLALMVMLAFLLGTNLGHTSERAKLNRDLIAKVAKVSKRTDREIAMARVAALPQTCKQFNDIQRALQRVIKVTLRPGLDPELRVVFEREHRNLAVNDCKTQRALLVKRLRHDGYDVAVPYQHHYSERP